MANAWFASLTPPGIDAMRPACIALFAILAVVAAPSAARKAVDASPPERVAVTIYRDPDGGEFDRNDPRGFAMISETRQVTLPQGVSTIRFLGVAEGMIGVSAIVTGLPGGTIEKNRNSAVLSPAALVDGTLGNRVTITRTDPATGGEQSEDAVVRTRADGGIVLQTAQGFEAVRCSGLPERLTFPGVPAGLSAEPVFTIDTNSVEGGTYQVTLTYLAWGFDWKAHYVATLKDGGAKGRQHMKMLSWLTVLNDNGQSFEDAELLVVAGALNIDSDFERLSEPPRGEPLRLECWPIGSTSAGSYPQMYPPSPSPPMPMAQADMIMVTGARRKAEMFESASPVAMVAGEENLGDLKLFRVPEPVSVSAKGLKQVAFLDKPNVKGAFVYEADCDLGRQFDEVGGFLPAALIFRTDNKERNGLGVSMPRGGVTIFEPSSTGDLLIGEDDIRDYAVGQEVEFGLGPSTKVFHQCALTGAMEASKEGRNDWQEARVVLLGSGSESSLVEVSLGFASDWDIRSAKGVGLRDGRHILALKLRPGEEREVRVWLRRTG